MPKLISRRPSGRLLFILAVAVVTYVLIGNHLWWHSATAGFLGLTGVAAIVVSVIRRARRRAAAA